MAEGEEAGFELGEDDMARTNSTEEGKGMGENDRGDDGWIGEVVRSMLLDALD